MPVLLTIVIVNYKTAELVCKVVDTAKKEAAADNVPVRIMVVDNGSGDGSVATISAAHPDIEVIDSGGNLGFSKGNNIALRTVASPYAMLLNSDAFIQPGAFRRLIDLMEANPEIGVIGPRVLNPDGTDQDYPRAFPTISEMAIRALKGPQFPAQGKDPHAPIAIDRVHGCCLMTRKSVLEQIGLLDEQFFMYDEDMDWCLRAQKIGWKLFLVPDATVIHLGGQTSGRAPSGRRRSATLRAFNPRMSFELRKSRYILYRKHRTPFEIIMLKALTDAALAAGCLLAVPALFNKDDRAFALKRIKGNLAIIGINPFALEVRP